MNWEDKIIDYINNELPEGDRKDVEILLQQDPGAHEFYNEVMQMKSGIANSDVELNGDDMVDRFEEFLKRSSTQNRGSFSILKSWRQAAAILLLVAFGSFLYFNQQNKKQIHAGIQELEQQKQELLKQFGTELSSHRIAGVQGVYQLSLVDDEIFERLSNLIKSDPSSNVRLAALKALVNLQPDRVTNVLLEALVDESNVIVQVALINALVQVQAVDALPQMQEFGNDNKRHPDVLNEMEKGIFTLQTL